MIEQLFNDKSECCGCETCANVCPKRIILMEADKEGFYYPKITNPTMCIECHRCLKVCPIKNVSIMHDFQEKAYAGYSLSQEEIKSSASGGLATTLARGVISQGGIVYGVAYTNDCKDIEYKRAETLFELEQFKTSKYAQSRKNDIFQMVKNDLNAEHVVLYIGLPCDTYALQLFLERKYENLYICSLMCHGTTSPLVHDTYIQKLIEKRGSNIKEFSLRYKKYGWKPYYIRAIYNNGEEFFEQFSESTYGIAFLYFKRPSCNKCRIKREKIHSDITIGDYHLASDGKYKPYNPYGVSSAIVHTKKGEYLLSILENFNIEEIPLKNALYSVAYYKAIPARENRKEFSKAFISDGLEAACTLKSIKTIERKIAVKAWVRKQGSKVKRFIERIIVEKSK